MHPYSAMSYGKTDGWSRFRTCRGIVVPELLQLQIFHQMPCDNLMEPQGQLTLDQEIRTKLTILGITP